MFVKLSEMKAGSSGIIRSFENDGLYLKFMEMGCIPGEKITMGNNQGDPITISVAGYQLSLRLKEAECIVVEYFI